MSAQEVIGSSVYVGIDWSDSKHDICIFPNDSDTREFDVIRHRTEVIDDRGKDLHERYGGHDDGLVSALHHRFGEYAVQEVDCGTN